MSPPATLHVYSPLPGELTAQLRTIRLHLLALQPTSPYRLARLVRIADQFEYVLSRWPLESWPQTSRQNLRVPTKSALLLEAAAAQSQLLTPRAQQDAHWRMIHKLLLESTLYFL